MKPVETGVSFDDLTRDGARLARAAGGTRKLREVAPLTFRAPLAPALAAEREGRVVDLALLDRAIEAATMGVGALIVEGAGGLLVPVVGEYAFDTLFARWALDVVIVAANRLGAINHTRLTLAAARAAGLPVRAVVFNRVGPETDESAADNAATVARLERVPVVELPWLSDAGDLDRTADAVERSGLLDLIVAAPVTS